MSRPQSSPPRSSNAPASLPERELAALEHLQALPDHPPTRDGHGPAPAASASKQIPPPTGLDFEDFQRLAAENHLLVKRVNQLTELLVKEGYMSADLGGPGTGPPSPTPGG